MSDTPSQNVGLWGEHNASTPIASEDAHAPPPPLANRVVRAKLQTPSDVAHELAKLYREARGGKLNVSDASRLANILALLSRVLESSDLEKRIQALEQRELH